MQNKQTIYTDDKTWEGEGSGDSTMDLSLFCEDLF